MYYLQNLSVLIFIGIYDDTTTIVFVIFSRNTFDPGYTVLATYMLYPVVARQNNNNDDSIDIDIISEGGGAVVR